MNTKNSWITEGILFGIFILILNSFVEWLAGDFTLEAIWKKILIYLVGGLLFGFIMKLIRKNKNTSD